MVWPDSHGAADGMIAALQNSCGVPIRHLQVLMPPQAAAVFPL
jgi:hypothetical protein